MTAHITHAASTLRLAQRLATVAREFSDRMHAAADSRAQSLGWTVTETPGWLGLSGRNYCDPRFAALRQPARAPQPDWEGRYE